MSYSKPIYTQRGVLATWHSDGHEAATCPWCHTTIIGHYTGHSLSSDEWCQHFCGWVSAGGSQVAANFSGPADEPRQ